MSMTPGKRVLSIALCLALVAIKIPPESGALAFGQDQQSASGSSPASSGYPGQGAPMSTQELQSLVAPIALYPDALVAQILSAATFPDQIAVANYWLEQNKNLTGSALMQAVNKQSWDPSVKALTQFPSVLDNMAKNLSWTSQLGEAYHNQASDVMAAVQTLRAQAKAAGNLKIRFADHGGATDAADYRHPTDESSGCLCPAIQPDGGLRHTLRGSRVRGSYVQYCRRGGDGPAFIWSWEWRSGR